MKLATLSFALNEIFVEKGFARVIILEDDLEIAPIFLTTFMPWRLSWTTMIPSWQFLLGTTMVLTSIQQILPLLCDPTFPGLGWMLNRRLWDEWVQSGPRLLG